MITLHNKSECSGCGACGQVCPQQCIHYRPDEEGFLYPEIDSARCIQCGLCERVCPMLDTTPLPTPPEAFACCNPNPSERKESSSGGVFFMLAEAVLEEGGAVFGAALNKEGVVEHICVERSDGLVRLRGSKYVQSRMGDCFKSAKQFLEAGRTVLFSGTPCQLYGLSRFLGKEYENLLAVDVVCMGVPSPGVWARYRLAREQAAGGKTVSVSFRDKSTGWRNYSLRMGFDNNTSYTELHQKDPYLSCFGRLLTLRPACHECRFKGENRRADLTLGDYWGIETLYPDMDDGNGVSLVLIRSVCGQAWIKRLQGKGLLCRLAPLEHVYRTHRSLTQSIPPGKRRSEFFAGYVANETILPLLAHCGANTFADKVKRAGGKALRVLGMRK